MRSRFIQVCIFAVFTALACMMRAQAAEAPSTNVEMDVLFVSFELKDIEKIARKTVGAAPTQEQIRKAWMAGKGRLLAINRVISFSGQQTRTEAVSEKVHAAASIGRNLTYIFTARNARRLHESQAFLMTTLERNPMP